MLKAETKITLVMSVEEAKALSNFIHEGLLIQILDSTVERYLEDLRLGLNGLTRGK